MVRSKEQNQFRFSRPFKEGRASESSRCLNLIGMRYDPVAKPAAIPSSLCLTGQAFPHAAWARELPCTAQDRAPGCKAFHVRAETCTCPRSAGSCTQQASSPAESGTSSVLNASRHGLQKTWSQFCKSILCLYLAINSHPSNKTQQNTVSLTTCVCHFSQVRRSGG